jgi:ribonuclease P protein component
MDVKKATFPKCERLSWKRLVDALFAEGLSFVSFPLRIVYLPVKKELYPATEVAVLACVPKKKIKHAVDRNFIKRRIRESYRLRKHDLIRLAAGKDHALLVAFLYLDRGKTSYEAIDRAMEKALLTLGEKMT